MEMRRARARPVEYFMLVEPRSDGPVVGYYGQHPIPAAVIDAFGARYAYVGVATRLSTGAYDVDALLPGEWIAGPGLVYYRDPKGPGILKQLFRLR